MKSKIKFTGLIVLISIQFASSQNIIIGRNAGNNMRFTIRDDASTNFSALLSEGGSNWGSSRGVSAIATGDVDGDNRDEIIIGRSPGDNMRFIIRDDVTTNFNTLLSDGGDHWAESRGVSAISTGDVDGDGRDEVIIGRSEGDVMRFIILDDATTNFNILLSDGGDHWAESRGVSAIATGDVDGDNRDEIIIGRNEGSTMKYVILDDATTNFSALLSDGGSNWASSRGVSAIATGNLDEDGRDEIIIGRNAGGTMRYVILDDATTNFSALLSEGGSNWASSRGVSAIATGNLDKDSQAEIIIGRNAGGTMRYAILDDATANFNTLLSGGDNWGDSRGVSALACSSDTIFTSVISITGGESDLQLIDLQPNPVFQELLVHFNNPVADAVSMQIKDLKGNTLLLQNLGFQAGEQQQTFNLDPLASGIYILELKTKGKIIRKKFVKQ